MFSCLALHFLPRFHGTPALQLRMDDGHVARALLRWLATPVSAAGVAGRARDTGRLLRSAVLVPALRCAVALCLVMSAVVLFEKASMGAVSLYAKVFRRRSHRVYQCGPVAGDEEAGSGAYPVVLVQIPMYNEKEVYRLSIGAACNLVWPEDRIVIQVLDDSTEPFNVSQVIRNHSVTACSCRVRD